MKNLSVSVKSRGVLLFAFNTAEVDYVKIAEQSARLIAHTLNLPVTIITDNNIKNTLVNIRTGYAHGTEWRNGDRYKAYELSPYDETLLLDSDYLMLDNSLLKLFEQSFDYRLMHFNKMINEENKFTMGVISLPYVWATALLFRKTEKTKLLFDLVGRIQRNYEYYRKLYNIRERNFRNDYAFAIANIIINGYDMNINQSIPWTMLTIDKLISNIEIKNNMLVIRQEEHAHVLPKQNIHVIDKTYLLSDNFNLLVDQICQE